jgi:aminoglycoside 6'-N-acetyltransferase I
VLHIRPIVPADRGEWLRLRDALWPGAPADHEAETIAYFTVDPPRARIFVADAGDRLVGFLELDYRSYANGCAGSPVPFIEGWYVQPSHRRRGIGRALVRAAEALAREQGFTEMGSDALMENDDGVAAHRAVGYAEVERVVCFRRSLRS